MYTSFTDWDHLEHHGVRGQKWGERRYQNSDGSLTPEGREHYGYSYGYGEYKSLRTKRIERQIKRHNKKTGNIAKKAIIKYGMGEQAMQAMLKDKKLYKKYLKSEENRKKLDAKYDMSFVSDKENTKKIVQNYEKEINKARKEMIKAREAHDEQKEYEHGKKMSELVYKRNKAQGLVSKQEDKEIQKGKREQNREDRKYNRIIREEKIKAHFKKK